MRLSPDPDRAFLPRWAARRRGVAEPEIVSEGAHLAAIACRQWAEPFFDEALDLGGRVTRDDIRRAVAASAAAG